MIECKNTSIFRWRDMAIVKELNIPGYEKVIEGIDESTGLHCFIAVHNSNLGPALGGTRIYPYSSPQEALNDALRLAKGMTYKSAVYENGLGGGKAVIICDPRKNKNEKLLLSFAEVVDTLKGAYIAAEDVGTTTDDMVVLKKRTPYVAALPSDKSSGDPSRFTAWGVFRGIQAVAHSLWHKNSLRNKIIAIQGVGSVGSKLANILFWEGADLIVCDVDEKKAHDAAMLYGAELVPPDQIMRTPCDIFAPCSMGGILNKETIPLLKCRAVAGAANNQLEDSRDGLLLAEKGILYAPDYILNAGGIINAAEEFNPQGYHPEVARDRVNRIYDTLESIFEEAKRRGKPPFQIADELAEYKLRNFIGKRQRNIAFKTHASD